MNTLTRAVNGVSLLQSMQFRLTRSNVWVVVLSLGLFLSALALVYVKEVNRRLSIESQTITQQNSSETERWSKLLLEQSTLTTQSRVEYVARKRLGMVLPESKKIKLVSGVPATKTR